MGLALTSPQDILILQPDPAAARLLADYFIRRGDRVHCADDELRTVLTNAGQ